MRAWKIPGYWVLPSGAPLDDDSGEVIRVLFPTDQNTPAVEVTDEMVERAAEACYLARDENLNYSSQWDELSKKFLEDAARYRQEARAAIKAALGVEK